MKVGYTEQTLQANQSMIGIITYWDSNDNYGQILQCYALQKYLKDQMQSAFLIRYQPAAKGKNVLKKMAESFSLSTWRKRAERVLNREEFARERELHKINSEANKLRQFDDFRNEYIDSTEVVYRSLVELRDNPPKADIYVCGSDQIWNNST